MDRNVATVPVPPAPLPPYLDLQPEQPSSPLPHTPSPGATHVRGLSRRSAHSLPHTPLPRAHTAYSSPSTSASRPVPRSSSFTRHRRFLTGEGLTAREALGKLDTGIPQPGDASSVDKFTAMREAVDNALTVSPSSKPPPPPPTSASPTPSRRIEGPPAPPPPAWRNALHGSAAMETDPLARHIFNTPGHLKSMEEVEPIAFPSRTFSSTQPLPDPLPSAEMHDPPGSSDDTLSGTSSRDPRDTQEDDDADDAPSQSDASTSPHRPADMDVDIPPVEATSTAGHSPETESPQEMPHNSALNTMQVPLLKLNRGVTAHGFLPDPAHTTFLAAAAKIRRREAGLDTETKSRPMVPDVGDSEDDATTPASIAHPSELNPVVRRPERDVAPLGIVNTSAPSQGPTLAVGPQGSNSAADAMLDMDEELGESQEPAVRDQSEKDDEAPIRKSRSAFHRRLRDAGADLVSRARRIPRGASLPRMRNLRTPPSTKPSDANEGATDGNNADAPDEGQTEEGSKAVRSKSSSKAVRSKSASNAVPRVGRRRRARRASRAASRHDSLGVSPTREDRDSSPVSRRDTNKSNQRSSMPESRRATELARPSSPPSTVPPKIRRATEVGRVASPEAPHSPGSHCVDAVATPSRPISPSPSPRGKDGRSTSTSTPPPATTASDLHDIVASPIREDEEMEIPEYVTIRRVIRRLRGDGTVQMVTRNVRIKPERVLPNGDVVVRRTMRRTKDDGTGTEILTVMQVIPRRKATPSPTKPRPTKGQEEDDGGGGYIQQEEARSSGIPSGSSTPTNPRTEHGHSTPVTPPPKGQDPADEDDDGASSMPELSVHLAPRGETGNLGMLPSAPRRSSTRSKTDLCGEDGGGPAGVVERALGHRGGTFVRKFGWAEDRRRPTQTAGAGPGAGAGSPTERFGGRWRRAQLPMKMLSFSNRRKRHSECDSQAESVGTLRSVGTIATESTMPSVMTSPA